MAVTPLNTVKKPEFTLPYLKPPGILNATAPGMSTLPGFPSTPGPANPTPPATPGLLTAPPMPQAPSPYTTNPATAKESTSVGYNPVGFTVDKNQTVAGQVENVIAKDSPLMQQAETRAKQKANARGLLNSSMAVGAGQAEVMNTALPIAQQDANTYAAAHTNTQNASNAALNFGAAAQNQSSQTNAQLGTNVSMANAEAANKALAESFQAQANYGLAGLDANVKIALSNLDTHTKIQLTTMENENRQFLQANQDAASMFNQVAQAIAAISQNPSMSEDAKKDAIASQMSSLNEGLRLQGDIAGLNLGGYFNAEFDESLSMPKRDAIPTGGYRDEKGNVYNYAGTKMDWRGPAGSPTYIGRNDQPLSKTQWESDKAAGGGAAPGASTNGGYGTAPAPPGAPPTGTLTNPASNNTAPLANWRPGMPAPAGWKILQDNRAGQRLVRN